MTRGLLSLPALALVLAPVAALLVSAGGSLPAGAGPALVQGLVWAVASLALALAVGVPAALGLRQAPGPLRGVALSLLALPWLTPPDILSLALLPVAGSPAGGAGATALAGALLAAGPVTLGGWWPLRRLGAEEERMAAMAGAGRGLILRRLVLPRMRRGLALGSALGFAVAAGQATVAARLGGSGLQGLLPGWLGDAAGPEALPGLAFAALLTLIPTIVALLAVAPWRERG